MKKILLAFLDHFESYICQFLLVFFVVVIFMQIILRQIDMSLPWTEEIARFAFIWFILFGACYATRLCALNRVTVQFSRAPEWVGDLFLFIGDIIWFGFSLVMAWEGYVAVLDLVEFPYATPALDWDLGLVCLVFPLSFLLMAIRIVQVNVIKFILKEEILDPDQEAIKESQKTLTDEGGKA
ncbi:MAG: TRAP transporter small permease [Bilophila sp.]